MSGYLVYILFVQVSLTIRRNFIGFYQKYLLSSGFEILYILWIILLQPPFQPQPAEAGGGVARDVSPNP